MKRKYLLVAMLAICLNTLAQEQPQRVEGFDTVAFHYGANRSNNLNKIRDYRGLSYGYMTAGWWASGQMEKNVLSWRTAVVPEKKATTFAFVAASSVLPAEITVGPAVKVKVNGQEALTFTIGRMRDYTWKENGFELKYISKRVEFPYTSSHREFDLNGNNGIYQLTVPASAVEAGKPALIELEMQPFDRWHSGWFMVKDYKDVWGAPSLANLQGQIDAMRRDVNNLNEQTNILATKLYAKMLGGDKFEHSIIYTNGYRHLHPADLIKLQNGDLLIMAREGTEHFANDGDVFALRSKDGGKTWGDKTWVTAIKDLDEREGCGIQLKDGTIIVGVFYNGNYTIDGTYNWTGKGKLPVIEGHSRLGAHFVRSTDNGKTWSKPDFIDLKGMPFKGIEGPTDAPIEMPDGSVIMGVIGYGIDGDAKNRGSVLLRSTDKGRTWKYVSTIASDPGGKLDGFMEPGLLRTNSGRLIAAMRNHGKENYIWMTYSDDSGKTWLPVFKTDLVGHPVDLIQLADGRILASYGVREGPGRHTEPGGIRACFSYDNGKTFDVKNEIQLRSDFINWDEGYPESIQQKDGRVLTVYYFNLFGKYYLASTLWNPNDFKKR